MVNVVELVSQNIELIRERPGQMISMATTVAGATWLVAWTLLRNQLATRATQLEDAREKIKDRDGDVSKLKGALTAAETALRERDEQIAALKDSHAASAATSNVGAEQSGLLSRQQLSVMEPILSLEAGVVALHHSIGSPVSSQIAAQFEALFRRCGWKVHAAMIGRDAHDDSGLTLEGTALSGRQGMLVEVALRTANVAFVKGEGAVRKPSSFEIGWLGQEEITLSIDGPIGACDAAGQGRSVASGC